MSIHEIMVWFGNNWLQTTIDVLFGLKVAIAGLKVMGWSKIADKCSRIEDAITAMAQAALNRDKTIGGPSENPTSTPVLPAVDPAGGKPTPSS